MSNKTTNTNTIDSIYSELDRFGELEFVFNPNDFSTLFQDAEKTMPVTGDGQPVGLMLDKSKS